MSLTLANIWQMHWRCVIHGDRWPIAGCLSSIRNQRYGQLAVQFQEMTPEDNDDLLLPMTITYTENSKECDSFLVPYHSSFAFLSDIRRYRKNQQHMVPIITSPHSCSHGTKTIFRFCFLHI
jgi:hypothetical protein